MNLRISVIAKHVPRSIENDPYRADRLGWIGDRDFVVAIAKNVFVEGRRLVQGPAKPREAIPPATPSFHASLRLDVVSNEQVHGIAARPRRKLEGLASS